MSTAGAGKSLSGPRLQGKGGPEPLASRPSPSSAHSTIRPQSGLICCPFHHCPLVRGRDYTRPHPQRFTEVWSEASPGGKSAHSGGCEEPHARRSSHRRECDPACQLVALAWRLLPKGAGRAAGSGRRVTASRTFPALPTAELPSFQGATWRMALATPALAGALTAVCTWTALVRALGGTGRTGAPSKGGTCSRPG